VSRRAFGELTERGRIRRIGGIARAALQSYDVDVVRVSYAARAFNTVFRVDTASGTSYALRVSPEQRIHADGCEELEAEWVAAIRRDTDVPVPAVIRARDGAAVVTVDAVDVPVPRTCVLFEWVPGVTLRRRVTEGAVRTTGALTARLHEHAATLAVGPDAGVPPRGAFVADHVLYLRSPNRLPELRDRYGTALDDALARAQQVLDALWRDPPHPPHLLHGDIQPGNVMVRRGGVTILDFQDLVWGFDLQDVWIAQRGLELFEDAAELQAAFRTGYETVRPWPEADDVTVAAIRMTRHLNLLNFGLDFGRPGLDEFVERHAAPVMAWMRGEGTG